MNTPNWKPRFFTIWIGQAISLFGSSLVQFALVWWLTQTTKSATVLTLATLVALLPQILLGPLAGVLVDRWNRRWVMIIADSVVAAFTVGLAVLFALGQQQIWQIYVIMFIRATATAFQFPAMQASTALLVPKEQLGRVAGLHQTLQGAMNIAAPPIGALLLQSFPLQNVLAIDVVTAVLGIAPLFFIAIPQPPPAAATSGEGEASSFWGELRAGIDYVRTWPGLMLLIGLAMMLNFLLNPAGALMPLLVTQHFQGGAYHLAAMESAFGIGMVVGGVVLGVWGGFKRRILTSLVGIIGLGLGFTLTGSLPAELFVVAVGASFLTACMIPITNGPVLAALQAIVAPEMQGRVFSLVGSLSMLMSPLSLAFAGPLADWLGVRVWFIAGGGVCLVLGAASFFVPALMHLEDHHTATAPVGAEAV